MKALSTISIYFVLPLKRQTHSMCKSVFSSITERHFTDLSLFGTNFLIPEGNLYYGLKLNLQNLCGIKSECVDLVSP